MRNLFLKILLSSTVGLLQAITAENMHWTNPVQLTNQSNITSDPFCAATDAGFMIVWADNENNAHFSFSQDGINWNSGQINALNNVVSINSDIFVAGNKNCFVVTFVDQINRPSSIATFDNGQTWTNYVAIIDNSYALTMSSNVFVAGSDAGFLATMIGAEGQLLVARSLDGLSWSAPVQMTDNYAINFYNTNSLTSRIFASAALHDSRGFLVWHDFLGATISAEVVSLNPLIISDKYPVVAIGSCFAIPAAAMIDNHFMSAVRINQNMGENYFSAAKAINHWATFNVYSTNVENTNAGPSLAANHAGCMMAWSNYGNLFWQITNDYGFTFSNPAPVLNSASSTINTSKGLAANKNGFVLSWIDTADMNVYTAFCATPIDNDLNTPENHSNCTSTIINCYGCTINQ